LDSVSILQKAHSHYATLPASLYAFPWCVKRRCRLAGHHGYLFSAVSHCRKYGIFSTRCTSHKFHHSTIKQMSKQYRRIFPSSCPTGLNKPSDHNRQPLATNSPLAKLILQLISTSLSLEQIVRKRKRDTTRSSGNYTATGRIDIDSISQKLASLRDDHASQP